MQTKENAAVIRKGLRQLFRNDELSVTVGRGTASGWVYVRIGLSRPEGCTCPVRYEYGCQACVEKKQISRTVLDNEILVMKAEERIKLHTYSPDDGIGADHDCLLTQINFI